MAAARRYLERTGNADLLPILGLAPDVPDGAVLVDGYAIHPTCGRPMPKSGRCRQGRQCRADDDRARALQGLCAICGNKLPGHGVCRRAKACREAARERGESA